MLTPKNNVAAMRMRVLTAVAESFLQHRFDDLDNLPSALMPDEAAPVRGSTAKDRQILKEAAIAVLGLTPSHEDVSKNLSDFAKAALKRPSAEKATVSVLPSACAACMKTQFTVTEMCRGCVARPCEVNCPKKTISVTNKAFIHQENCIKCGMCANVCPYGAINKAPVPCEDACPVGAITKDENGVEHIDENKCISCGKCLLSCPFGAIVHNSQMIDVLNAVKNGSKPVIAMLAPAVIGQFGNDIGKVITALKQIGFADVVEVAEGADVTTTNEAAEFIERMNEGKPFMTTSCCPAWIRATETALPEIQPYVSNTGSPMYYMAEIVKRDHPDCVAVFVGPCLAKRLEAEKNPNVDYVLVFEEIQAVLAGSGINVAACESATFAHTASAQGRIFPVSGGVAGAVAHMIGDKADYRPEPINGLNKEALRKLKMYATKGSAAPYNMVEVMCCEGGCVGGPGCVVLSKKAAVMVDAYVKTSPDLKDLQENK
jgi:[FeFe] hydrogenase (group B1/B3)